MQKTYQNIIAVLTSNRFKSFYWRTAMVALAGFIGLVADSIELFEFSPTITTIAGLVLGEISKAINSSLHGKKAIELNHRF